MTKPLLDFLNAATSKDAKRKMFYRTLNIYDTGGIMTTDSHRIHWVGNCTGQVTRQCIARTLKSYTQKRAEPAVEPPTQNPDAFIPENLVNRVFIPEDLDFAGLESFDCAEFEFCDAFLFVRARDSFFGILEKQLDVEIGYIEGEVTFYMNPKYFHGAKGIGPCNIRFTENQLAPVYFVGVVDGFETHAIAMPMRPGYL